MDRLCRRLPPADGQAPLEIRANPMLGTYAATVCAIVHDEMFFLEAFLEHYRRLGADRFIILDDCSTDGTIELPRRPARRDGGRERASATSSRSPIRRRRWPGSARPGRSASGATRCSTSSAPASGRWWSIRTSSSRCRRRLPAFFAELAAEGAEAAWGAMVDMYPERVARHPRAGAGRALPPRGRLVLRREAPPRPAAADARPRRCRAPSIRGAWRGSSPPGGPAAGHRSSGGSAAGSRATATRAPA